MSERRTLLDRLSAGMDYAAYRALVERVVAAGATTGPEQTEKRISATKLNLARMRRWDKTLVLDEATITCMNGALPQTWLVLTEAWCGDAAQNLPAIAAMAKAAPSVDLRCLLRDEHPQLMDAYTTQGARSIPKLIAVSADGNELFTWGPRPSVPQAIVVDNKALPESERLPYAQLTERVHRWYTADGAKSLQQELRSLVSLHASRNKG